MSKNGAGKMKLDTSVLNGVPDAVQDAHHIILLLFLVESAKEKMEKPVSVPISVFDADQDAMAFSYVCK